MHPLLLKCFSLCIIIKFQCTFYFWNALYLDIIIKFQCTLYFWNALYLDIIIKFQCTLYFLNALYLYFCSMYSQQNIYKTSGTRYVSIAHGWPHFSIFVAKFKLFWTDGWKSCQNGIKGHFLCLFLLFNREPLAPYSTVTEWTLLFSFVLFTVRWVPIPFR